MSQFKPIFIWENSSRQGSEYSSNIYNWKFRDASSEAGKGRVRRSSWQYYLGVF